MHGLRMLRVNLQWSNAGNPYAPLPMPFSLALPPSTSFSLAYPKTPLNPLISCSSSDFLMRPLRIRNSLSRSYLSSVSMAIPKFVQEPVVRLVHPTAEWHSAKLSRQAINRTVHAGTRGLPISPRSAESSCGRRVAVYGSRAGEQLWRSFPSETIAPVVGSDMAHDKKSDYLDGRSEDTGRPAVDAAQRRVEASLRFALPWHGT
ncbi:hypothetical protein BD310DRAFT_698796 [Dichomitus squalens]|uniref:Uncharacterized protein n=1 Tax=Dichomitus squalens TaxID=114155 RepID=A0A4Q9Q5X3_9APHY|nr:hypothetical protein BD310DRAFT_698796 [Dichomitus squalens]